MKKSVAIIGGGPSAFLLAAFLEEDLFDVTIYEKNKSVGRKFLVAGKGGFNLSHSEAMDTFIKRYTPDTFLKNALLHFNNDHLRAWLDQIGIPTFIGSSKRIYPIKGIKPIEVLNKILEVLKTKNIRFKLEHTWNGWSENNELIFNETLPVKTDYVVFAIGGGSWKVTGSDGKWLDTFNAKSISTKPFQAANCAFQIDWPSDFIVSHEGKPLKNIAITTDRKTQKGEVVISQFGLEGNAIYALSPQIQDQLNQGKEAKIFLDLKPMLSTSEILNRLQNSKGKNISQALKSNIKLNSTSISLLKSQISKEQFLNPEQLAKLIKSLPLIITAPAPVDQAISTSGGIDLIAVNSNFELNKIPQHFCIGEMLDWNAPTGGYLLQACFSMGAYLAQYLNHLEPSAS